MNFKGSYTRDLLTPTGRIEDLKVPRDREGQFHSQVFERYSRSEPEVAEALTQMFVSGVSTHKVGEIAETLTGVAPSASAVSRLNQALTEQYETWHERTLLAHYRIIYLDGIHFTVRHGEKTDATMILTTPGVDLEGNREVLAFRACAEEDKDGWSCLLQNLRTCGVTCCQMTWVTRATQGACCVNLCCLFLFRLMWLARYSQLRFSVRLLPPCLYTTPGMVSCSSSSILLFACY